MLILRNRKAAFFQNFPFRATTVVETTGWAGKIFTEIIRVKTAESQLARRVQEKHSDPFTGVLFRPAARANAK
jgi:hypothetical protein